MIPRPPRAGRRLLAAGTVAVAVSATIAPGAFATPSQAPDAGHTYTIAVLPPGEHGLTVDADRVVPSLAAAQAAVRQESSVRDVVVELAGGTYDLPHPLRFTARDGGQDGHTVTWTALPGQQPVLSGGSAVTGWTLHDPSKDIWVAHVPQGSQSRQLYVDGKPAQRTRLLLAATKNTRTNLTFSDAGITVNDPTLGDLSALPDQSSLEIEELGSFTDRFSPVQSIQGNQILMQQPAWDNNTSGFDTLTAPYAKGALYLDNSYAFLDQPNQWYLDSAKGLLYYRAEPGQSVSSLDVRLPRLQSLAQISGTYDQPVHNLSLSGLTFADTTWLEPSGDQGYVDQQAGAHLVGTYDRPSNALTSCQNGCPTFEQSRNEWHQIPAAVQVTAAHDIALANDSFTNLGEVGVGIGMDPDAYATGPGYGASDIAVTHSSFTQSSAAAIVAGGIQPDAHHPSDPRMTDRDITMTDNTIAGVSQDYQDNPAILSTYIDNATISHNSISDLPYDGIDIGWGWGTNDPGGDAYYQKDGLYAYQPVYQTPTTFKDNTVSWNLIHDTKQVMNDGGSLYSLSASPGTVFEDNYVYDNHTTMGALLDQGSRYITVQNNVFQGCSYWVYINSDAKNPATFNTKDLTVTDNWFDAGTARNPTGDGYNNQVVDNAQVTDGQWPADAQQVISQAGARP